MVNTLPLAFIDFRYPEGTLTSSTFQIWPAFRSFHVYVQLFAADSLTALPQLTFQPDVVFLDPMFPSRQKSALIKKKFQLLQQLEQPCLDEEALLQAALAAGPRRIVIKRPLRGPFLAGRKPDYTIRGNSIRYDCLVLPG